MYDLLNRLRYFGTGSIPAFSSSVCIGVVLKALHTHLSAALRTPSSMHAGFPIPQVFFLFHHIFPQQFDWQENKI